jgi:hypothetical protein
MQIGNFLSLEVRVLRERAQNPANMHTENNGRLPKRYCFCISTAFTTGLLLYVRVNSLF